MNEFNIKAIDEPVSSSKQEILLFLKKNGTTDLKTLSDQFSKTKMGILKHINALEELGYIERETEKAPKGRPKVLFKLSESSKDTLFPNNYVGLTNYFLGFIEENYGIHAVKKALRERTLDVQAEYKKNLSGKTLEEKVTSLRKLRDKDGYMAEQKNISQDSFELLEYNCPILRIADQYSFTCGLEKEMFENILDSNVTTSHRVIDGGNVCRFIISKKK